MAIVTISRGSFSGGKVLAERVAERLGYRPMSRELVVDAAARYGISEKKLFEALERPPSFWERFRHDRRLYLTYLQAALCEEARADNLVYHGYAGHLLLKGVGHVVRVRLIAPLEYRIVAAMEREQLGRDDAVQYIQRVDHERTRWTKFLYGVDWSDPQHYDVVVNLERIDLTGACELVRTTVGLSEFQTTSESQQALEDLILASRVRAALAGASDTSVAEVEVEAHGDVVTLRGKLSSSEIIDEVVLIAEKVSGVHRVDRSGLSVWTYPA